MKDCRSSQKHRAPTASNGQGQVQARLAKNQPECNRQEAAEVAHRAGSRAPLATLRSRGSGRALLGPYVPTSPYPDDAASRPPTVGQGHGSQPRAVSPAAAHTAPNGQSCASPGWSRRASSPQGRNPPRRVLQTRRGKEIRRRQHRRGFARLLPPQMVAGKEEGAGLGGGGGGAPATRRGRREWGRG
jgi:hypothetical protein